MGSSSSGDLTATYYREIIKLERKFSHNRRVFMHAQPRPLRTLICPPSILTGERGFSHRIPSFSNINKYTQLAICNGSSNAKMGDA